MKNTKKHLMPKATAIWLLQETSITFKQIGDFCELHVLEVENIANGESAIGVKAENPIIAGKIDRESIKKAEQDPNYKLKLLDSYTKMINDLYKKQKTKYIPLAIRKNKPKAILWLIEKYPNIRDAEIVKLLGTTKKTIENIKNKTHKDSINLEAQNPVILSLCTQDELDELDKKYQKD